MSAALAFASVPLEQADDAGKIGRLRALNDTVRLRGYCRQRRMGNARYALLRDLARLLRQHDQLAGGPMPKALLVARLNAQALNCYTPDHLKEQMRHLHWAGIGALSGAQIAYKRLCDRDLQQCRILPEPILPNSADKACKKRKICSAAIYTASPPRGSPRARQPAANIADIDLDALDVQLFELTAALQRAGGAMQKAAQALPSAFLKEKKEIKGPAPAKPVPSPSPAPAPEPEPLGPSLPSLASALPQLPVDSKKAERQAFVAAFMAEHGTSVDDPEYVGHPWHDTLLLEADIGARQAGLAPPPPVDPREALAALHALESRLAPASDGRVPEAVCRGYDGSKAQYPTQKEPLQCGLPDDKLPADYQFLAFDLRGLPWLGRLHFMRAKGLGLSRGVWRQAVAEMIATPKGKVDDPVAFLMDVAKRIGAGERDDPRKASFYFPYSEWGERAERFANVYKPRK